MGSPFVIVLPVRNGGHHLRQAIDSILCQSRTDWRLFVLENGSDDDTVAIIQDVADPRITLVASDRPLAIEHNWARSLPVLAEYGISDDAILTFIGHDDVFAPDFLAQVAALVACHPDATLYQTPFDLIDAEGRPIRPCRPIPTRESGADLLMALCWGIRDSFGTGYAFRVGDFRATGGFPLLPKLLYADHLLFTRLAARGYKVATQDVGCSYRLHRGSASNTIGNAHLNDHTVALLAFVNACEAEFPEVTATDRGRAALSVLLARELFILETPAVSRLLTAANAEQVRSLAARLAALRAGPGASVPGPFPDLSPLAVRLRRWRLRLSLFRRR